MQWDSINIRNLPTMDLPPGEYARYTVRPGDLLVCEGGEVGRCALWPYKTIRCGYQKALHRLRPRDKERDVTRFLYYAIRAAATRGAFYDGHLSTIAHLTGEKLRKHRFPFPPRNEQASIVDLLDHDDRRMQRCIQAKYRSIALLDELWKVILYQTVAGIINVQKGKPYSAYSDVRLEWLCETPAHWKVHQNRRLFSERSETGFIHLPILEVSLHTGVSVRTFAGGNRKQQISDRRNYKRAARGDIAYNMMRM